MLLYSFFFDQKEENMARPYSTDLREKVLGYLEKNSNKKAASDLFQVGIATIYRWVALKKKKGHVKPLQRKYAYKRIDDEALLRYIKAHPDQFLSEIGKYFSVTPQAIFYALKRLKITRKKRQLSTWKETKKSGSTF
jgi:transposase